MMIRYTLRQLEYFVAVGDAGSIILAATRINVSSPSISAAISQLEGALGLPLFVRQSGQGLSLTRTGRTLLDQARAILREADRLMDMAGEVSARVRGPLSVGAMRVFAQLLLAPLRRDFVGAHPDVRFRQLELDPTDLVGALRHREIDVALAFDLVVPPDMKFVPLLDLPPFAIVGPQHPLASRSTLLLEELRAEPMILFDLPEAADYVLSFFHERGIRPDIVERSRDMAVVRSLVANGFGYTIANLRPMHGVSPDGRPLRFIPLAGDLRPIRMGMIMTHMTETTAVLRSFVDFTRRWVRDGFATGGIPHEICGPRASPAAVATSPFDAAEAVLADLARRSGHGPVGDPPSDP